MKRILTARSYALTGYPCEKSSAFRKICDVECSLLQTRNLQNAVCTCARVCVDVAASFLENLLCCGAADSLRHVVRRTPPSLTTAVGEMADTDSVCVYCSDVSSEERGQTRKQQKGAPCVTICYLNTLHFLTHIGSPLSKHVLGLAEPPTSYLHGTSHWRIRNLRNLATWF